MYDKALTFFEKAGVIQSGAISLQGKAMVLDKMGKIKEAMELFEKGISNVEKVRTSTPLSDMKMNLF